MCTDVLEEPDAEHRVVWDVRTDVLDYPAACTSSGSKNTLKTETTISSKFTQKMETAGYSGTSVSCTKLHGLTSSNCHCVGTARHIEPCAISGLRREVHENCAILRYYTASGGNSLQTFRDTYQSFPSFGFLTS